MRRRSFGPAALVAVAALGVSSEREARACGGCFAPPGENDSVVTDHRMVLSVSAQQTTLWDQIRYSGAPSSFAWVLPVSDSKVATLGLSADLVFGALDTLTTTRVLPPPLNCPAAPSCQESTPAFGGAGSAPTASDAGAAAPGVEVNKEEVVGPYDVAFLHSTDPNALNQWLTAHGYAVSADVQPVIGAYVAAHYDFIAMKLVPGAGVSAMRPVRVTTPGAAPVLPLRMVAAGTGPIVSITLWVLGEGRYNPQNFGFFSITADQVTWDWAKSSSDFDALRKQKNADTKNTEWEVESSIPLVSYQLETLIQNGGNPYILPGYDAGSDYAPIPAVDAGPDAASTPGESASQVRQEDIAALTAGMSVSDLRVTRIRADLAHASLANDLVLEAGDQSELSNFRQVTKESNEPLCPVYAGCDVVGQAPRSQAAAEMGVPVPGTSNNGKDASSFSCASAPGASRGITALALAGALGLLGLGVRRRRR